MSIPAAILAARPLDHRSRRPAHPAGVRAYAGTLDMMGAPMSFSRNEEIYGEAEDRRVPLQGRERRSAHVQGSR